MKEPGFEVVAEVITGVFNIPGQGPSVRVTCRWVPGTVDRLIRDVSNLRVALA